MTESLRLTRMCASGFALLTDFRLASVECAKSASVLFQSCFLLAGALCAIRAVVSRGRWSSMWSPYCKPAVSCHAV